MKILVVEDDSISLKLLESTLASLGYETASARDGKEAWEIFQKEPTPIIVSDWMMPEMDGLEFCSHVRKAGTEEHKYTYFILLTARTGKENQRKAMEMGVDDFLTKPFDQDELFCRIRVARRILGYATEIHQLKKLIPICMYCKKVRNDDDYWQQIEAYLHEHAGTDFSHGICSDCLEKIKEEEGTSCTGKVI